MTYTDADMHAAEKAQRKAAAARNTTNTTNTTNAKFFTDTYLSQAITEVNAKLKSFYHVDMFLTPLSSDEGFMLNGWYNKYYKGSMSLQAVAKAIIYIVDNSTFRALAR